MTQSQPRGRRTVLALLAVLLTLSLVGCSALMLLLQYFAVASTINSLFNNDDDTYSLYGYVYIDRTNNKIAIQAKAEPPSEPGTWQVFSSAVVRIDTSPERVTATNTQGYFRWDGITDTHVILTVEITGAEPVKFNVTLVPPGEITPL
jgi:hypothetical protein